MMLPNSVFCFDHFVAGMANGTSKSTYCNGRVIFSQGDDSDSLFYVRDGRIKCTFVSSHGKERIVAILKTGQFFGEGCIIGHAKRAMTATAMPSCAVTQIEKITMLRLLCEEPDLAETVQTTPSSTPSFAASCANAAMGTASSNMVSVFIAGSSVEEIDIEIRPVDARMAARAIAPGLETQPAVRHVGGERIHVALQAQEPFLAANQQVPVHAAVRRMAGRTALHFYGRVLEHEWPALLDVALRAGFPARLSQRSAVRSAMWIVAVRALDRALIHTVFKRHGELSAYRGMAAVCQRAL
jgi:NifU-like protein involved in Fe-S cluster formation